MLRKTLLLMSMLCLFITAAAAQENSLPEPQPAEVTAEDGVTLVGDFYAVPDAAGEMPSVLLLHGMVSNRYEWNPVIQAFLDKGYNVLTVDQRGSGESGGERELVAAIGDVAAWLAWLREQPTVADDQISTIGSSWGTVTALAGCAADESCLTAIILSPGDFPLLDEAMFERMSDRSLLIVIGRRDNSFFDAQKLFNRAVGEVAMHVYNTGAHGTSFVSPRNDYRDSVLGLIFGWLDDRVARLEG